MLHQRGTLFLCIALYVCNVWLGPVVPSYWLGAYSFCAGLIWLLSFCGWRDALAFVLCYGCFLWLQTTVWALGHVASVVRFVR